MLQKNYMTQFSLVLALLFLQMVVFSTIALSLSGGWNNRETTEDLLHEDITVAGIRMGGISVSEAETRLQAIIKKMGSMPLEVTVDKRTFPISKKEIQLTYDVAGTVQEARMVSQELSGAFGMWKKWRGTSPSPDVPFKVTYNRQGLTRIVDQISHNVDRPASGATGRVNGTAIVIVPEQEGYKVDIPKTIDSIDEELKTFNQNLHVPVVVKKDIPTITNRQLDKIDTMLGEQITSINPSVDSRIVNIQRAVSLINGSVIMPEQIFSFNTKAAPYADANGYIPVPIMSDEEIQDGTAGGVSQVASTLYMAAVKSGLPIVERHHNVRSVEYIAAGFDAFVNGQKLDLRFANRQKEPLYIHAEIKNNQLRVAVFGSREAFRQVDVQVKETESFPPDTIVRADESMAPGQEKIIRHGKNGMRVKVFATSREKNGVIKNEQLSDDYYKPLHNIIAVGPRKEGQNQGTPKNNEAATPPDTQAEEPAAESQDNKSQKGNEEAEQGVKVEDNVIYLE